MFTKHPGVQQSKHFFPPSFNYHTTRLDSLQEYRIWYTWHSLNHSWWVVVQTLTTVDETRHDTHPHTIPQSNPTLFFPLSTLTKHAPAWGHNAIVLTFLFGDCVVDTLSETHIFLNSHSIFVGFCQWTNWERANHTVSEEKKWGLSRYGLMQGGYWAWVERGRKREGFDCGMVWKWVSWGVSSTVVKSPQFLIVNKEDTPRRTPQY